MIRTCKEYVHLVWTCHISWFSTEINELLDHCFVWCKIMQYLKHAPSCCKTCTIPHLELLTCSITDFYKRTRIGLIPKVSTINLVTDCKLQLAPIGLPSSSSMSSVLTCLANASTCRSGVVLRETFNAIFALFVEFWPFYVWTEIPLQMQTDNLASVIHILN